MRRVSVIVLKLKRCRAEAIHTSMVFRGVARTVCPPRKGCTMYLTTTGRKLGMKLVIFGSVQLVALSVAFAQVLGQTPYIFDVRRSLPLEPDEPVYHDFYINAGPEAGLKKGQFVSVIRQVPVHDPIQNKQQATLTVSIGKLQIIHVERGITVARLHSELGDDERPTVEFEAVMVGDRIDLGSLTMTAPKGKKRSLRRRGAKASESHAPANVARETDPVPGAAIASFPAVVQAMAQTIAPAAASQPVPSAPSMKPLQNGPAIGPEPGSNAQKASPAEPPPGMVRVPVPSER